MDRDKPKIQPARILSQSKTFLDMVEYAVTPPPTVRLPTWSFFNQFVGGFRMREFSILCGPTGCGKTTFLANVSAQLVEAKVKHFVMSIETGHLDYMLRVLSVWEGRDLNMGDPIPRVEMEEIAVKHMGKWNEDIMEFSLYETRLDVDQLQHEIRTAVEIHGCKIVFIDNLNFLLRVTRAQDQNVEMDRVVHDLIEFVKTIDVHIVMVMHPKKTEHGRVLSEFDIKGSSTSVQEAQNVWLLNPPATNDKEATPTDRDLFFAKLRRRGKYRGRSVCFKNQGSRYLEVAYK